MSHQSSLINTSAAEHNIPRSFVRSSTDGSPTYGTVGVEPRDKCTSTSARVRRFTGFDFSRSCTHPGSTRTCSGACLASWFGNSERPVFGTVSRAFREMLLALFPFTSSHAGCPIIVLGRGGDSAMPASASALPCAHLHRPLFCAGMMLTAVPGSTQQVCARE